MQQLPPAVDFAFTEHIMRLPGNNGLVSLEHGGDLFEAQLKGLMLQTHLKAAPSVRVGSYG